MYWTAILQETPETTRLFVIGMIVIDSQITKIVQLVDDFQVNNQLSFLLTLTPAWSTLSPTIIAKELLLPLSCLQLKLATLMKLNER